MLRTNQGAKRFSPWQAIALLRTNMSRAFLRRKKTAGRADPRYPVLEQDIYAPGPLSGFRIIDFSQMVSGPMATQILGDQGADIIKIESPSGAAERGNARSKISNPMSSVVNRNKRSLSVNLKSPEGVEVVKKLLKTADAMIHNFRPGAMKRLGLGYDDVKKINESIVYLHISGFGTTGPYSKKRVYDPVIQSASGLATIQADETGRTRLIRLIVPDKVTSLTARQAMKAGLKRAKTGEGSHIKLSMLDALIQFAWAKDLRVKRSARNGQHKAGIRDMILKQKMGIQPVPFKIVAGLCNALGHREWIEDKRFATAGARSENRQVRLDLTEAVLKTMTTKEALKKLDEYDVPSGIVNHPRKMVLEDPQVLHNNMLFTYYHKHAPFPLLQARSAAKFDGQQFAIRYPAPIVGESTKILLKEIGYSDSEVNRLLQDGIIVSKSQPFLTWKGRERKAPLCEMLAVARLLSLSGYVVITRYKK